MKRLFLKLLLLTAPLIANFGCRTFTVTETRPDGTQIVLSGGSLFTDPNITSFDAKDDKGEINLQGYKSVSRTEIIGLLQALAQTAIKP